MKIKNIDFYECVTKTTVVLFDVELDNGKVREGEAMITENYVGEADEYNIKFDKINWSGSGIIPDRANVEKAVEKKIMDKYKQEKRGIRR